MAVEYASSTCELKVSSSAFWPLKAVTVLMSSVAVTLVSQQNTFLFGKFGSLQMSEMFEWYINIMYIYINILNNAHWYTRWIQIDSNQDAQTSPALA